MSQRRVNDGPRVHIVLSSYNGARYIGDQIESIRAQSQADWVLLVRDDGSSDGTPDIVARFEAADPRILRFADGRGNLGPTRSFAALLEHATSLGAQYVALCDQDDVWRPDKLTRQLALLRAREAVVGPGVPLLAHTDLAVVSDDLAALHRSFIEFQRLKPVEDRPLRKLLVQNFVTGCATLVNRALLRVALPMPDVLIHDWWLALCAAAFGEVLFDPAPTVRYRQHAANVLGARGWVRVYRDSLLHPLRWWHRGADHFTASVEQAGELARRCAERLGQHGGPHPWALELLDEYRQAFAPGRPRLGRLRAVRRNGVRPSSLLPSPLAFYARVLFSRSPAFLPGATPPGSAALEPGVARQPAAFS